MEEGMEELHVISKLVRMSVFGTREDIPAGVNWPKVFADAGVNGVSALCYEAVKTLPQDKQPDFDLLLRWDLSAQGLREGFRHRHEATQLFSASREQIQPKCSFDSTRIYRNAWFIRAYG